MATDYIVTVRIQGHKERISHKRMREYVQSRLWYWFHGDAANVQVLRVVMKKEPKNGNTQKEHS